MVIIAVLTYFPAVSLGPIVEHYLMHSGRLFSLIASPLGANARSNHVHGNYQLRKPTPNTPLHEDPTSLLPKKLARARPLFDPEIVRRAIRASFVKLNPVTLTKNPVMFVVEVGAVLTTVFLVRDMFAGAAGPEVRSADRALALVHGAVRQLRRSDGRSARQGAGRQPAQDQDRRAGQAADFVRQDRAGDGLALCARATW